MPKLSIIVPVFNEGERLTCFFSALKKQIDDQCEIIGIDGGSTDNSLMHLKSHCDIVGTSDKGRAHQMNYGASLASGNILLFVHADSTLPEGAIASVRNALQQAEWGRFDIHFNSHIKLMKVVGFFMNIRSRVTKIATGDQALFFKASFFKCIGSYSPIPLMEDIDICKRAKKSGKYVALSSRVTTSARRWESKGVLNTILLMWRLRLAFALGVSPNKLAMQYYGR